MKNIFYFLIFLSFICSNALFAQQQLPKGFAPGEREAMSEYIQQVINTHKSLTPQPPSPVRTMAEWEELGALVITWTSFPEILTEIVRAAREEVNVMIVCASPTTVSNYLEDRGVDVSSNVQFITGSYDSIWVRDYGPNSGYLGNVDSLVIVDWIYNRPRYQDDLVPYTIAGYLGTPIYATNTPPDDLVNTGGNFMVDGMGRGFSSELVLDENGPFNTYGQTEHTEESIDSVMNEYMGLDKYIKMKVLPYDAIHHIDMHMKLLDERTLLVGQYPEGIADGPQIEANIQYVIHNFESAWGRDFKVVRMPMPPDQFNRYPHQNGFYRTYTNSIIINKTILIPTYEEKYDTTAFRIWEELMPGYKLVGINCNDIIPLSGALHCITKEVGTSDPLQISHARLPDVYANQNRDYSVEAVIRHRSGIEQATLYYSTDLAANFTALNMTLVNADEDLWEAFIPEQAALTQVYYYLAATAVSGKQQARPMPAPEGFFDFKVLEDLPSAISDPNNLAGLHLESIYPNPAGGITVIPVSLQERSEVNIELLDATGKRIDTIFKGMLEAGSHQHFLMANRYAAGVYFVELSTNGYRVTEKLVIQ